MIDKLDVRRAQVFVEALIVEVTADKAAEFGIQWQDLIGGSARTRRRSSAAPISARAGQNILGIAAESGRGGTGPEPRRDQRHDHDSGRAAQILNLGLLVRALETDANANILSTPTLLTLDNEEAKIVVGQNVPFITGSVRAAGCGHHADAVPDHRAQGRRPDAAGQAADLRGRHGAAADLPGSVQRQDTSTNPAGIITNKRSLESTVLVDDGQIVVLGGLIQDTVTDGADKVPVLGDIPLIGSLFRYDTRTRTKTNLMVFLRPTVLRNAERADALTSDRYDYILGEQHKAKPAASRCFPISDRPACRRAKTRLRLKRTSPPQPQ